MLAPGSLWLSDANRGCHSGAQVGRLTSYLCLDIDSTAGWIHNGTDDGYVSQVNLLRRSDRGDGKFLPFANVPNKVFGQRELHFDRRSCGDPEQTIVHGYALTGPDVSAANYAAERSDNSCLLHFQLQRAKLSFVLLDDLFFAFGLEFLLSELIARMLHLLIGDELLSVHCFRTVKVRLQHFDFRFEVRFVGVHTAELGLECF